MRGTACFPSLSGGGRGGLQASPVPQPGLTGRKQVKSVARINESPVEMETFFCEGAARLMRRRTAVDGTSSS